MAEREVWVAERADGEPASAYVVEREGFEPDDIYRVDGGRVVRYAPAQPAEPPAAETDALIAAGDSLREALTDMSDGCGAYVDEWDAAVARARALTPSKVEPVAEPESCGKADRWESIDEAALLRKRIRELETAAAKPAAEPVPGLGPVAQYHLTCETAECGRLAEHAYCLDCSSDMEQAVANAAEPVEGRWIRVEERLPEPYKLVQFAERRDPSFVRVGTRDVDRGDGHEWQDLTDQDACGECATWSDEQVYQWRYLDDIPLPPAPDGDSSGGVG